MQALRDPLSSLCDRAAAAILEVYEKPWDQQGIEAKADDSPLTAADLASHQALVAGLPALFEAPIISEEGKGREVAGTYWLVDPLDGTKEFIKRNGEFTVNVALVDDGAPVLGCVQVPVTGECYFGGPDVGAWKRTDGKWRAIACRDVGSLVVAVVSKSHRGDAVDGFLDALRASGHDVEDASFGSSLKICKVAEGSADVYPRLGPTMPWDTAAAHAVLLGAGGTVMDDAGRPLRYPKMELNPWFIAGAPGVDWARFVPAPE